MKKYSIRDIEQLTGIKAHTIRMWEKRYNILEPDRTETNIRKYSDQELKRILNISILNSCGLKISRIACLSDTDLAQKVVELQKETSSEEVFIERLVISMVEMDEHLFEDVLDEAIEKRGFEDAMLKVVYPFLQKIGVLWQTGSINPAQEHFISHLIRQKLMVASDGLKTRKPTRSTFILFLPVNELHEIGLLFYNYVLRARGFKVVFLGQSVPFDDLEKVMKIRPAKYMLTFFVAPPSDGSVQDYINKLHRTFPKTTVFVTGFQLGLHPELQFPEGIVPIKSVDEVLSHLK
jgi:MerR family transcriptional regulator, light-induced transcriptional regulator